MIRTSTVLTSLVLLVAAAPRADELHFAPKEGSTATRTISQLVELASESMSIEIDGNEITPPGGSLPEISIVDATEIVVTDEFVKCADGRATSLVRSFDTIGGKVEQSVKMGDQEQSEDPKDKSSGLQGKKVKFTWDAEKEEYTTAFMGEEKADEALLSDQTADMDLAAWLPKKGVAEGDSWEVDAKLFDLLVSPGGDLHIQSGDDEDDEEDTTDQQMRDNMSGKITLTYKGVKESEGSKLAVLEVVCEVATKAERPGAEESTQELEIAYEMKGELHWNPESNRLQAYELEGPTSFSMTTNANIDDGGESHTMKQIISFKGTTKVSLKTD